jgi:HAD superfamily hydrolase (TIGR01509 family)
MQMLEFKVKLPNGRKETRAIECNGKMTLLDFFGKAFRVGFKDDPLGPQVAEIEKQRSSFYHFVLIDKATGKKFMPYAELESGKRVYLDLRHIVFSPQLARKMAVEVFMVYDHRDMENSVATRYDGKHAWFKLDEFTGEDMRMGDLSRMMKRHYVGNALEDCRFHFLCLRARLLADGAAKPILPEPAFSFDGFSFSYSYAQGRLTNESHGSHEGSGVPDPVMALVGLETPGKPAGHVIALQAHPVLAEEPMGKKIAHEGEFAAGESLAEGGCIMQINAAISCGMGKGLENGRGGNPGGKPWRGNCAGENSGNAISPDENWDALGRGSRSGGKPGQGHERDESRGNRRKKPFRIAPFFAPSSFKAVIFDLDGVVVDSERAHRKTFNQVFGKFKVHVDKKDWARNYTGVGSHAVVRDVFEKNRIGMGVEEGVKLRAKLYQGHIEKHGLPVIPGFLQFCSMLQDNGIKVAIGSGTRRSHIRATLKSIGAGRISYVGHEDVEHHKPAPETFLLAAKRLGVKPSECIVFEDSLAGMEAASRAGMPCVALCTTLPRRELSGKASLVISDFRDAKLKRLVAALLEKKRQAGRRRRTAFAALKKSGASGGKRIEKRIRLGKKGARR